MKHLVDVENVELDRPKLSSLAELFGHRKVWRLKSWSSPTAKIVLLQHTMKYTAVPVRTGHELQPTLISDTFLDLPPLTWPGDVPSQPPTLGLTRSDGQELPAAGHDDQRQRRDGDVQQDGPGLHKSLLHPKPPTTLSILSSSTKDSAAPSSSHPTTPDTADQFQELAGNCDHDSALDFKRNSATPSFDIQHRSTPQHQQPLLLTVSEDQMHNGVTLVWPGGTIFLHPSHTITVVQNS